jgi:hypothetical protein
MTKAPPTRPRSEGPYGIVPAMFPLPGKTHQVQDNVTLARTAAYSHKDALHTRDWLESRARGYVERREVFAMLDP